MSDKYRAQEEEQWAWQWASLESAFYAESKLGGEDCLAFDKQETTQPSSLWSKAYMCPRLQHSIWSIMDQEASMKIQLSNSYFKLSLFWSIALIAF